MIGTKDLILRQGAADDWRDLYRNLWSREEVFRYMFKNPCPSEEHAAARTGAYAVMHEEVKTEFFVCEKASGQAIGIAGIKELKPGKWTITDIAIGPDFQGKGYGKQIVIALLNLAFELGATEVAYDCFTQNTASKQLALSCGFTYSHSEEAELMKNGEKVILDYYIHQGKLAMEITRINTYEDNRFSTKVLLQHGCFLVDGKPYEVEIISDYEATISGEDQAVYAEIIEEFRFYTPHITRFYSRDGQTLKEYPRAQLLTLCLDQIQPSQFFVDEDKIAAISSFIHKPQDIIIQVLPNEDRFISLDGHTRLYYAVMKGWECVRAVVESSDDWVYKFVTEAQKRGIYTPKEMTLVSHDEYEEKWNRFCDDFFAGDGVE